MVTQAPKRSSVFAALAFALSCVGLIIFVWTQFGGTIPFAAQGYRLGAVFPETGLLVPNADVRISGVNVGKVTAVRARGVNSFVTMDIQRQYAPIPVDTRAILRQKTLLGEAYIELSAGNGAGRKFPDGGTIPSTQVQHAQALDQVLGSFGPATQRNLQALLQGSSIALAGRGQDLNNALGNLDPAVTELSAIVGALNDQQGDVQRLISSGATVFTTLGDRSTELQTLVRAGDQVFSATAARDSALTATVDALPPFLTQLRTTLTTLNRTLGIARPSLDALKPVAHLLPGTLNDLIRLSGPTTSLLTQAPSLIDAAEAALPSITRFSTALVPAVDALLPASEQVVPVINIVTQYRLELVAAMSNLAADTQATGPAATPSGSTNYLRAISGINREAIFGQTIREPTNRSNTYFAPGALSELPNGLRSANCNNTGNVSQIPVPFSNVPCRVQPAFPWGNGILSSYYPHTTAAKVPSK
jgi:phospholipid/cholesterol/gamma-HCH transport system substrate-binding protein